MADMTTPSAATMGTINAGADIKPDQSSGRPSKPDDETFKAALEKANKVFEAAQKKVVSPTPPIDLPGCNLTTLLG